MDKGSKHDTSSDSDDSFDDIECKTCGVSFSSLKSYQSHKKGKKHHNRVAQEKFLSKGMMARKKEKGEDNNGMGDDDDDDDDENEMHCEVCDKNFSGHVSYMAHLRGSVHAKYVKKQKLKKQMVNTPEVLNKEHTKIGEEDDDDTILPIAFGRCSICQKEFSGPEPLASHLKSNVHKKKVEQSKMLDIVKKKYQDETNKLHDNDFFAYCDVCQKSFSGPVPYHIHMKSAVHNKNLEKRKVAEEVKEFYSKDGPEAGYVCKECKKTFTDPVGFKHHLANNNHDKQKAKSALSDFLNEFPEITYVTPFDEQNAEDETDSDGSSQDYYLICKICHASFSGPESAKDHVKSKKHISMKKDKNVLKLLKEQKKQRSDSMDSTDKQCAQNIKGRINNSVLEKTDSGKDKSKNLDKNKGVDGFEMI